MFRLISAKDLAATSPTPRVVAPPWNPETATYVLPRQNEPCTKSVDADQIIGVRHPPASATLLKISPLPGITTPALRSRIGCLGSPHRTQHSSAFCEASRVALDYKLTRTDSALRRELTSNKTDSSLFGTIPLGPAIAEQSLRAHRPVSAPATSRASGSSRKCEPPRTPRPARQPTAGDRQDGSARLRLAKD